MLFGKYLIILTVFTFYGLLFIYLGDSDWVNENFESIKGTNTKHYNFDYKQLDQEPSKASSTVIKNINMEHYNFDGKRLDKDHREVPSTAFE